MVVITGTIPVKAGQWNDAQALAAKMMEAACKKPSCISYRFHTVTTDEHTFPSSSRNWESVETFAAHLRIEHQQNFLKEIPNLLAGALNAKKYTVEKSETLSV